MMSFESQATADLAACFNEFAETVTYNGSSISAVVDYEESIDEQQNSTITNASLTVKASDVTSPTYRDVVVIDSVTWHVRRIVYGDGYIWELDLMRDERPVL